MILFISILILTPSYIFVSADNESFMSTVLTTVHQARAIRDGYYPFWTSQLGFGMPQPFAQSLYYHPAMIFFAFLPTKIALVLFYQLQLFVGGLSMWALCIEVKVDRKIASVCAITYLLSASTLNYCLTDFWPSVFFLWTLFPGFWLVGLRLVNVESKSSTCYYSILFGLLAGLMFLNGHSGVTASYFLITSFLILSFGRSFLKKIPWFILSVTIFLLLTTGRIYHFVSEQALFSEDIYRTYVGYTIFNVKSLWGLLFKPLVLGGPYKMITQNFLAGTRFIWFGSIFFILALVGGFYREIKNPYRKNFTLVFIVSMGIIHLPKELCFRVIAWLLAFRDPLTISGILLAGMVLTSFLQKKKAFTRRHCNLLLTLHLVLMIVGVAPFWLKNLSTSMQYLGFPILDIKPLKPYKITLDNLLNPTELTKKIQMLESRERGRVYFSKTIYEKDYYSENFGLVRNTLSFHGIPVVPGYFKGISYDVFYPDNKLMHGHISPQNSVLSNKDLLDVLGIKYILADPAEKMDERLNFNSQVNLKGNEKANIFINKQSWPEAFFVKDEAIGLKLKRLPSCEHDRLLCADYSVIKELRTADNASIDRKGGEIMLSIENTRHHKIMVLSEYYRKGWNAFGTKTTGENLNLNVFPIFENFIGIKIPSEVTEVRLRYKPFERMILEIISWASLFLVLIILAFWGQVSRRITPSAKK